MKKFSANHLELRYRTYFAVLYIPKDVRVALGKSKFFETTGTGDLKVAQSIASMKVIKWKAEIANARSKSDDPIINSATELNRLLKNKSSPAPLVKEIIEEETERIRYEQGELHSDVFRSVAVGESKVLKEFLPTWKKYQQDRGLSQKNIDQMYGDIELVSEYILTTNMMTYEKIHPTIKYLASKGKLSAHSVNRIIKSNRNFYKYLQTIEIIPEKLVCPYIVPNEFKMSKRPNSKSIHKTRSWVNFEDHQVVSLYQEAIARDEETLAQLIKIAAYTGARIEEICSLKKEQVNLEKNTIQIINAKTDAGNRFIPIHRNLKKDLKRLLVNDIDEYVIPNLTFNKYGDRSNAIGKKFGRLKKELGYGDRYVFHSIRKTVTTQLENANVNENITADILGHEKPRITYGQYSGGATLKVKEEALSHLTYDFDKKVNASIEASEEMTSNKTKSDSLPPQKSSTPRKVTKKTTKPIKSATKTTKTRTGTTRKSSKTVRKVN